MDVRLVGVGLRAEAAEEARDLAVVVHHERRVAEVDEEELREHRRHRPAAPPLIDDADHGRVVRGLGVADVHRLSVMRILVLGGTQFLGRHVVDTALEHGHDVTLFNRGQTRPELFAGGREAARRPRRRPRRAPRARASTRWSTRAGTCRGSCARRSTRSATSATTRSSRRSRSTRASRRRRPSSRRSRSSNSRPRTGARRTAS